MEGIENETLDPLLECKEVRPEIRQQVREKGVTSVIHFAGAPAENELSDWFTQSTTFRAATRDVDGNITDWNQESPSPRELPSLSLGVWASRYSSHAPI